MLKGAVAMVLAAADSTFAPLHAQGQTPPPPIPDTQINVSTSDAIIGRNDLLARVPVELSVPAPHTLVVEYSVQETLGPPSRGAEIVASHGQLIFHPGEQHKIIELQLRRPIGPTQSIDLRLADFGYPVRAYATRTARITSSDVSMSPSMESDTIPLPSLPSGGSIVFTDDLREPDFANDSGFRPDGRACWQSRLARTRQQVSNKEAGYYADPALNPEAKVWGIDPSTGFRFIQAEYIPGGLLDGNGGKFTHAWEKDVPFTYSAAMVTSRTLFNRITIGSYVEFQVKLARVAGSWPALWLLRADDAWPPEIDVIEAFISSPTHAADVITSSIHWRGEKKDTKLTAPRFRYATSSQEPTSSSASTALAASSARSRSSITSMENPTARCQTWSAPAHGSCYWTSPLEGLWASHAIQWRFPRACTLRA
ncbi:family 16 glycosylhydrolase [Bradyrhizobium sp. LLZ17]|uniref:Family 16 glycosylhydrolase n=1 Tax=Bradyrhizobium sp. LLZ17 TaxID=3239388 RepID=A0AB39XU30_9BRAD